MYMTGNYEANTKLHQLRAAGSLMFATALKHPRVTAGRHVLNHQLPVLDHRLTPSCRISEKLQLLSKLQDS